MKATIGQLPPSVNSYLGRGHNGRVYRTIEANNWLLYAKSEYHKIRRTPFENPVEVWIGVKTANKGRDLDNLLKMTIDSLRYANIVKEDNMNHIWNIQIMYLGKVAKGKERLEIEIREIEE